MSLSEIFLDALSNTLLGMGTVFAVLIIIILCIMLMSKCVRSFEGKGKKEEPAPEAPETEMCIRDSFCGRQKRGADPQRMETVFIGTENIQHMVVFHPVDDMGRLNDQIGKAVPQKRIQRFRYRIYMNAIPCLQLPDDHAAGEGAPKLTAGKTLPDGFFDGLNIIDQ